MSGLLEIIIDIGDAVRQLDRAAAILGNPKDLYQDIAKGLESVTEGNFEAQGRPHWAPLEKSTIRERMGRNKGSSTLMILQDNGTLAASVSSDYGSDFAVIGAGGAAADYAAIQQFGGEIKRAAYPTKVRLRTDAKGNLLRQAGNRNLAIFASNDHKRARESWHEVGEYTIKIPARPYLPFSGPPDAPVLQPEAETSIMEVVDRFLRGAFGQ